MQTQFCIEQLDTGLYFNHGTWEEEPEWFDGREVVQKFRSLCDPSPLAIRGFEFEGEDA